MKSGISKIFLTFALSLFISFMYVSCGGGGSSTPTPTTPVVELKTVNVFVTSRSENKINNFTIDRSSGAVLNTQALTLSIAGQEPYTILVHPNKRWIFTMNRAGDTPGDGSVTRFSFSNGVLTEEQTLNLPFFDGLFSGRASISIAPSGNFMFLAHDISNVRGVVAINSATGAMTLTESSATGANILSSATNVAGTETFLAMYGANELGLYNNNATTGATSGGGTLESLSYTPSKIMINPSDSNMLIVASSSGNKLATHSYNSGGPNTTFLHDVSTTISPDDFTLGTINGTDYIFTAGYNNKKLASYSINATGVISAEIDTESITSPSNSQPIAVGFLASTAPYKNLLFLADRAYGANGQLGIYEVSSGGQMTFLASAPAIDAQAVAFIAN